MCTWRQKINDAIDEKSDVLISCTLREDELDVKFDDGFGGSEGKKFTAWGEKYVYFPVVYDGAEWVGSAPRNPCDEATEHQGGE
jgi:hypothetical protein